jgi:hypothetical protein
MLLAKFSEAVIDIEALLHTHIKHDDYAYYISYRVYVELLILPALEAAGAQTSFLNSLSWAAISAIKFLPCIYEVVFLFHVFKVQSVRILISVPQFGTPRSRYSDELAC